MSSADFEFNRLDLIDGKPVVSTIKTVKHSDIGACPHHIMVPEHYQPSGACRCTDPEHTVMADWGYVWKKGGWR
jgi:hypothetical protein